jgi:hypothetical protein
VNQSAALFRAALLLLEMTNALQKARAFANRKRKRNGDSKSWEVIELVSRLKRFKVAVEKVANAKNHNQRLKQIDGANVGVGKHLFILHYV